MLKLRYFFFTLFIFFASAYANQAVDRLSQKLKGFTTYQAQFIQKTTTPKGDIIQTSQGKVRIMPPGRFRWETLKPNHQVLMTDGKTLWIYDVDLSQATEQALNQRLQINPASILSGSIPDLEKNFVISELKKNDKEVFFLKPKNTRFSFHLIKLIFEGNRLLEMQINNNLDEMTHFMFHHIILNEPMRSTDFKFNAPKGVEIVKQ